MHSITLQTSEATVVDGDILGRLAFAASSEESGLSDDVAAQIEAVAEKTFYGSANATEFHFSLAADGTVGSVMSLSSAGLLSPSGGITSTAASNTLGATSFNDANITNVGNIALDSITADGSTITITGNTTFADGAYDFDIASHDTSNGLKLGGALVTATAAELNLLDGSSAGTVANSKAVIYSAAGIVQATDLKVPDGGGIHGGTVSDFIVIGSDTVTIKDGAYDFDIASHDTSNGLKLGGTLVTATAAELNYLDITTLGTAAASKALTWASDSTWTAAGGTCANLGTVTTVDINGGTIDGTTIGASTHTTGKFTTVDATTDFTIGGTVITDGTISDTGTFIIDAATNIELDSAAGIWIFEDGGTEMLRFTESNTGDVTVKLVTNAKALIFTDNADAEGFRILDEGGIVATTNNANQVPATINGASSQASDLLQLKNSDGDTLFVVDAIGQVGIGESVDPGTRTLLHVSGGTTDGNKIMIFESGSTGGGDTDNQSIMKLVAGTSANVQIQMGHGTGSSTLKGGIKYKSDDSLVLRANSADALTIAAEGDVTFAKAIKPAAPAAASGTSGIVVLDCDTTNHFTITTGGNITGWNFTNASVGQRIIVRVTNGASHTVAFSSTGDGDVVYFPGGTEPTLTVSGGIDVYGFLCVASDTFDGFIIGQDIKA